MKNYPNYSCADFVVTEGRVILVDVPLPFDRREELLKLKTIDGKELVLVDVGKAVGPLDIFLERFIGQKDILFVFPGNGSNYPKSRSKICQQIGGVGVYAKRVWLPGSDPFAIAGTINPELFMDLRTKTIVVVDDVISSGQTMYKLYRNNEWRFPSAKWIGVSWFSQILCMRSSSGIKGYERVFASFQIRGDGIKKVPINSLSTLIEQPSIATNYATRHFVDFKNFLDLINYDPWIDDLDHHGE